MTTPINPTKYLGPNVYLNSVVVRNREPTGADYRQPETGKLYPVGCIWQVGKNPTTGLEGDLWMLGKIVSNVAYWNMISSVVSTALLSLTSNSGGTVFGDLNQNIFTVGTGSITGVGVPLTSTITFQLTGLTNHNVLVGAGTATITKVAPSATVGIPLVSAGAGADPLFGTTTVPGGGTGATTLTGVVIGNGTSPMTAQVYSQLLIQQVYTESGAVATGSTLFAGGDAIPANTGGDQYMTLAITPKSASNILVIEFLGYFSNTDQTPIIVGIFQDATVNALAAQSQQTYWTANSRSQIAIRHQMVSGTASATTFNIRVGATGAGTLTFNGNSGSREMGGVCASSLRITEFTP